MSGKMRLLFKAFLKCFLPECHTHHSQTGCWLGHKALRGNSKSASFMERNSVDTAGKL